MSHWALALVHYLQVSVTSQNDHDVKLEVTVVVTTSHLDALVRTSGVLESGTEVVFGQSTLQLVCVQTVEFSGVRHVGLRLTGVPAVMSSPSGK